MKHWEIHLDVTTVYEARVEAETEEEAIRLAEDQAYEDTWGCSARYDSCKVYTAEQITAQGLPIMEDKDED
jgi:hypothetical protein